MFGTHSSWKLFLVATLALSASVSDAQSYVITDLTSGSGFDGVFPYGISQDGRITGAAVAPVTGEIHAFIFQNGAYQDLGTLGYPYGADGVAINTHGQVAATGYGPGYKALLYSNGQVVRLGSIDGGSSEGLAINDLGHIVGRAVNGDGGYQGFTYIGGHFAALNVTKASAINNLDQVAGSIDFSWVQNNFVYVVEHAFLLSGGTYTDLGSIGGGTHTDTEAFGINDYGQVTGYSTAANGAKHAFLYTAGTMADLGTFFPYYTKGISVNNHGDVMGNIETFVGAPVGVFLYSYGTMKDLLDISGASGVGWSEMTACHMNDQGWIVGYGTYNGESHGFLARPRKPFVLLPGVHS